MHSKRPTWHDSVLFGLHYDLHATADDTGLGEFMTRENLREQLAKVNPDWVQCDCKGHPGYTSWPTEVGSTSPGVVKDTLRIFRDVTRDLWIPLVMHYSGVIDIRATDLHPDWARKTIDGSQPSGFHELGSTCNLGPYTDELMIPQMLELIDKYDVDGFWVDGECWGSKFCYCDRCTSEFTRRTGITEIPTDPSDANWPKWADFHRSIFDEHVARYTEAVKERKPECTVCSNWMYSVCHPSEVGVPVDYLSGDCPPSWVIPGVALESRFIASRGMNWDLMAWGFVSIGSDTNVWTFKPAAQICQEAAQIVAQGGAVSVYDVQGRNGLLVGWHQDIMADVAHFVRARRQWVSDTQSVPQVALLHSAAHYYGTNGEYLMEAWSPNRGQILGALDCLLENSCSVDVVSEPNLIDNIADYELVVIAEQTHPSTELLAALKRYAKAGGKILISGANASDDYSDLTGTIADGPIDDRIFYIDVNGESTTVCGKMQPVKLDGAASLTNVLKNADPAQGNTGVAAITNNRIGDGNVIAIHSDFFKHYSQAHYPRARMLVGNLISALSCGFIVKSSAATKLQIVLRRRGNSTIVHLLNVGSSHPLSPNQGIIERVDPINNIRLDIKCTTRPSRVYIAPSFEGLTWEWSDGALRVEIDSVGIMDSVVIEN